MCCPHDQTTTVKRARDPSDVPEWENAIIEQCDNCREYIVT